MRAAETTNVASNVLRYTRDRFVDEPAEFRAVRERCEREGLPVIGPETGRALEVLSLSVGARRILEVGTLLGYSSLWLARAVGPGGRVTTIDIDPARSDSARENAVRAELADRIEYEVGAALDVLPRLEGPFDVVFLDAVKEEYPAYLEHALRLVREGGLLLADNALWGGRVAEARGVADEATQGVIDYTLSVTTNPRLATHLLPFGDGLAVSVLRRHTI